MARGSLLCNQLRDKGTYIWQCKIKMQCQIHITSTHYSMGQVSESLCLNSNGETFKNKSPNTVMKENSSSSSSRS